MPIRLNHSVAVLLALYFSFHQASTADEAQPNIVFILADDLGYGDAGCLNAECKIATPSIDRIAAAGMIFTDAHSSSAVCTPTRYSILTGRYNWRALRRGVLGGYSRPLIPTSRMTVASLLKQNGYQTACIGKWHLGLDWPLKEGGTADDAAEFAGGYKDAWKVDYEQAIQNGPTMLGFDTYFGISASLDMPPYVFIRDDRADELPTVEREFWPNRKGPASEDFRPVHVLPSLAREAVAFIDAQANATEPKPFFLYMPLNSPHTPIAPDESWQGKSQINEYADFVMQTDAAVGQVLDALDRHEMSGNTLVIFTSDNGCSPQANFKQLANHGHNPNYRFRGHKADIYEGGHRIPFVVRWPGIVPERSTSDQTICLIDLMATCAEIVGVDLPDDAGEDSVSILPVLRGTATEPLHEAVVHHSINGSFSIRQGKWKLILCPGSGGWSSPAPGKAPEGSPPVQLFDLETDVAETRNVEGEHTEVVDKLCQLLEQYVSTGRSTPGRPQRNDVKVDAYQGHRPLR